MKVAPNKANVLFLKNNYRNNICGFLVDILGFKELDQWQVDAANAIMNDDSYIAIKSATGTGKTMLLSGCAIWRVLLFFDVKVVCTSASYAQLKGAFINTVRTLILESMISEWFNVSNEGVTVKGNPRNYISFRSWSIDRPQAFAGVHASHVMGLFDESSAIPDCIFDAWSGNMQGEGCQQIMTANPTRKEGQLYDAFTDLSDMYTLFTVTAFDSSYVSDEFITMMARKYGESHDQYLIRVLGEFPRDSSGSFIAESETQRAIRENQPTPTPHLPKIGGLDVGSTGDETVLAIRQGNKMYHRTIVGDIDNLPHTIKDLLINENIDKLYIDAQGVGNSCYIALKKMCDNVYPVVFGKTMQTEKTCANKRTMYWYRLKQWLKEGKITTDSASKVIRQASSLMYTYDMIHRYELEKKEHAKKARGVKSPDIIDAMAYTFCEQKKVIKKRQDRDESTNMYMGNII